MKSQLVFATANENKIREIQTLLPPEIEIIGLRDIPCFEELPETHATIAENSLEKADYVHSKYGVNCFSEDSGLEIEALNGAPGVNSAHYSGSRDPQQNMKKVLTQLAQEKNREARFKTVFTLILNGKVDQFTGIVTGRIAHEPKGMLGFGYDPIFVPNGYTKTFAEMAAVDKVAVSHRTKAFLLLVSHLKKLFLV